MILIYTYLNYLFELVTRGGDRWGTKMTLLVTE